MVRMLTNVAMMIVCLVAAASASGQAGREGGGHVYRELTLPDGRTLRYAIVVPGELEEGRPYPVLLALPPGNQDERMVEADLAQYWEDEALARGWVVVSPIAPAGQALFHDSETLIGALMDHIASEVTVEGGKFHVAGASNGGRLAFRVATLLPQRVSSVLVLPGYPPQRVDVERLGELSGKPVTLFVGEKDSAWRDESERTHRQLLAAGVRSTLNVLPDQEHVLHVKPGVLFDVLEGARTRQSPQEAAAGALLDAFHEAAAKSQFDRYFELFAENGVFVGTDASERWTVDQFKRYARPHFERGEGWVYTPVERNLTVAESGDVAWFDELLTNAKLGTCRGTGVLVQEDGAWKVAQYNLSIAVPNDVADRVVRVIRANTPREQGPGAATR